MQVAVKILASLFAAAAGLVLAAVGLLVWFHFQHLPAGHRPDRQLLVELSVFTTAGCLFAALYLTLAWLLWRRVQWRLTLILCAAALFVFPVGTALAVAAFVLLTRPSVKATFTR
jgi:hypothetical protein